MGPERARSCRHRRPVAAFVFGARPYVHRLLVGGRTVVEDGRLLTGDEDEIARDIAAASRRLTA